MGQRIFIVIIKLYVKDKLIKVKNCLIIDLTNKKL